MVHALSIMVLLGIYHGGIMFFDVSYSTMKIVHKYGNIWSYVI